MRLHRLIAILLLVESRGRIKAKELAQALETSVRTIYRDIDTLCEAGIPLAASSGPSGGVYLMDGYEAKMNRLYTDDVMDLYLSGIGFRPESRSDSGMKLKNALLRLEKILPKDYAKEITAAKERFFFDEEPWWGERPEIPHFDAVRRSVLRSKKIRIRYAHSKIGLPVRTVRPYGLVLKSTDWYLAAFCERSESVKTFKCERITKLEMTDESFEIPQSFSLERYWKSGESRFKQEKRETESYPVTVKLKKQDAELLKRFEVYKMRYAEDCVTASVNMHKFEYARDEAMEIIGKAEIVTPKELRDFAITKLKEISDAYLKES